MVVICVPIFPRVTYSHTSRTSTVYFSVFQTSVNFSQIGLLDSCLSLHCCLSNVVQFTHVTVLFGNKFQVNSNHSHLVVTLLSVFLQPVVLWLRRQVSAVSFLLTSCMSKSMVRPLLGRRSVTCNHFWVWRVWETKTSVETISDLIINPKKNGIFFLSKRKLTGSFLFLKCESMNVATEKLTTDSTDNQV